MVRALVVEPDDVLRSTLHDLLHLAGIDVLDEATTVEAGLAVLDTYPSSLLVLVSNEHPDHHRTAQFFEQVVTDVRLATQHQYLLLSTTPTRLPANLAAYLARLDVKVLLKPFDMDTLLACLSQAAERLAASPVAQLRGEQTV